MYHHFYSRKRGRTVQLWPVGCAGRQLFSLFDHLDILPHDQEL